MVGGGTAGWMAAALSKKVLGSAIQIELVESEAIGIVGVGEATIPPIQNLNTALSLDEREFLRDTKATIKLAIRFENWRVKGERYYHTFGAPGNNLPFCHFQHLWMHARSLGYQQDIWQYDLNYQAAVAGRFAKIASKDPRLELTYAYHFDAGLFARFLRHYSEKEGVVRTEGMINHVGINPETGDVETLKLENGKQVSGDLFIDCSGFRSLLLQGKLGTGYEDWSHWLPCDRAVAVPSECHPTTAPYTRSIAHSAGWQWRIPLQHRNGNGMVFSSRHWSTDEAIDTLMGNLDTAPLGEPREIRFRTGRARQQWNRNVIALGLASGFIEPLESTSIHLIQTGIVRLLKLFPHNGISPRLRDQYNKQSQIEFEQIRDFIILHYHLNEREDSRFWGDLRNMEIPDSLKHKIELFRESGTIIREQEDLFAEPSWLQVMMGQGIMPKDYHPAAKSIPENKLGRMMEGLLKIKSEPVSQMPEHNHFLKMFCGK